MTGVGRGFSCVVGNPPWDKVDFEDKKYFSVVDPDIAEIAGAARRTRIAEWEREHPEAGKRYREARRAVKGTFHFAGDSGVFPLCGKGLTVKGVNSLQTDDAVRRADGERGRARGAVRCHPADCNCHGRGVAAPVWRLHAAGALASLYDFENRRPKSPALPKGGKWFESVDSRYKFLSALLTGRAAQADASRVGFFLSDVTDLEDPDRVFALDPEDLARINPNTGTLPVFRTQRDADITAGVYRRVPVLWNEGRRDGNPWGMAFKNLFNMTDDSDLFRSRQQLEDDGWELRGNVFERGEERMLPLYEAKMVDFFNHRAADVIKSLTAVNRQNQPRYLLPEELEDPARLALPLSWVQQDGRIPTRRNNKDLLVKGVELRLAEEYWDHDWLCGWCDVTASTNERTAIPAFLPRTGGRPQVPLDVAQRHSLIGRRPDRHPVVPWPSTSSVVRNSAA